MLEKEKLKKRGKIIEIIRKFEENSIKTLFADKCLPYRDELEI